MDISVITIIYNVEKYIERALNSLFTQTKTDGVEFILVNDCTPDSSIKIAQKVINRYPELNVKIINNEVNKGIAKTRQIALNNASGKYLFHLDPDDWIEPNTLEDLYNITKKDDYDVISFAYIDEYKDAALYTNTIKTNLKTKKNILINYTQDIPLWNKFIKRSLFTNNDISFDNDIDIGEDAIIAIKISPYIKKATNTKKAYLHYTRRKSSISTLGNKENNIKLLNRMISALESNPDFDLIYNHILRIKFALFRIDSNKIQKIKSTLYNLIFKKPFKEKIKTLYRYILFSFYEINAIKRVIFRKLKRKHKYELFD